MKNIKILPKLSSGTVQAYLVGNSQNSFSRDTAHLSNISVE